MSVRSETKDLSANMQQALTISPEVMRTAAQESGAIVPVDTAGQIDHLNPANEFNTSNPEHPLKRTVVVNIRASLNDLCLKKARATWQPPNADATKSIFQQRKFVDLQGTSEAQGNLKSVVLHKMALTSQRNTFPIALGVRISGVDDATFSQTGEAYSAIALPQVNDHSTRVLQEDDTALAYECTCTLQPSPTRAPPAPHPRLRL